MEHCHNTVHEDNAMLVRWEIDNGGAPFLRPLPTPIRMIATATPPA
jgi:manganese oxidase